MGQNGPEMTTVMERRATASYRWSWMMITLTPYLRPAALPPTTAPTSRSRERGHPPPAQQRVAVWVVCTNTLPVSGFGCAWLSMCVHMHVCVCVCVWCCVCVCMCVCVSSLSLMMILISLYRRTKEGLLFSAQIPPVQVPRLPLSQYLTPSPLLPLPPPPTLPSRWVTQWPSLMVPSIPQPPLPTMSSDLHSQYVSLILTWCTMYLYLYILRNNMTWQCSSCPYTVCTCTVCNDPYSVGMVRLRCLPLDSSSILLSYRLYSTCICICMLY